MALDVVDYEIASKDTIEKLKQFEGQKLLEVRGSESSITLEFEKGSVTISGQLSDFGDYYSISVFWVFCKKRRCTMYLNKKFNEIFSKDENPGEFLIKEKIAEDLKRKNLFRIRRRGRQNIRI